ncbi:chromosome segregation protein SMC [Dictyobacter kobayashii]|uniref:Chromosome partition protein Smc n=1 Tax=Dictyobacter kobayashii TaxID=2014872 RepID=A0A402ABM9_9CHLR|nr:chromosome segregation protein SMC [Dictyobacter kobayashii]GCE16498.1 chromosome partition protein Smc [Dictyobacter kobayashii]
MYLKRLEMLGFKSFASRTFLEFSPGITAVVGPNGAGKSNVADSMRWVLGEQSMRQLRGKKSDDIIFAGGQGKAPLGMAEVSLTLDNSTGWVPSEYSEITVTRRSYRSGENEYLINKQKVRLKDVLLLLAQARIGHDSYTVVGQGLIDAALSLRAEERRALFEDAAGIRPFQVQRTDAENRLKQTEQNVERLRDIVSEIEPRLAPLAEQAKRAVEFSQLNDELHDVLLSWYALQWRRLHVTREYAERAEREQGQKVRQGEVALQMLTEQSQTLRSKRQQIQTKISEARIACDKANELVRRLERDLAVNEERIGGLERQRNDIQAEERRLRERSIALQKQSIDLEEQCDLADEAVDNGSTQLASLEGKVAQAQKEYEMDERRLRSAQSDLVQVQARLGSTQTELGRLQKQLGERNRTLASRRDTISQSQQSQRTLEGRLVEERGRLETVRTEEQQLLQRKQSISKAIADAQQELERMKGTLAEAERRKRTTVDRLNMLKNWRQSLSGYSDGVRALLRAPADSISGLVGPVPQLGVVSSGMEMALEAALGPYMQAVVVQTLADAQRGLAYLQKTQAGRAMIIWMERIEEDEDEDIQEVRTIQGQVEERVLQRYLETVPELQPRILGFAWKHLRCETRFIPIFLRLLHGVVLAQDLAAAHELLAWGMELSISSDSDLPFTSLVTLDGEVLHLDGWLTGGNGKAGAQQGLLAHERELRELPQHLDEINLMINQLHDMMSEAQRKQEGRRAEQNTTEKELQKVVGRINEINKGLNASQRELERVQTEIRLAASIEQQLASEVAGLEQEVTAAQERARTHEKSQREMTGLVEELQIEMEERATSYRRQQDELGRERTALAVKRQEARSLRQQLSTLQTQAQDLKTQVQQQVTRIKEAEQQHQSLQESITRQRTDLEEARQRAQTLTEELRVVEGTLAEVEQQILSQEQQRSKMQQSTRELEATYRRSLLDSQKARDALETLLAQLQEEMGITDPEELTRHMQQAGEVVDGVVSSEALNGQNGQPGHSQAKSNDHAELAVAVQNGAQVQVGVVDQLTEEEETQLRKYRRRIESLRSRIKAMGGCDVNAPQLYTETKTRYDFLSSQIADLDQAAQQLYTIISQLDVTMARQFEETFQAVNTRFKEHFTTLFNGGTARLELMAAKGSEEEGVPPSSMPGGVEVIVQPPGKKVQDLSLLSGGERALVSAALLFSLLEINPPPFCLLDEVDAALDESNVTRFCDILKRLAQRTQFIVITHNRVTMTAAQAIYGVTMRESASRLLSLRLEQVPASASR